MTDWQTIKVKNLDAFVAAMERAESKGYLPDAIQDAWSELMIDADDHECAAALASSDAQADGGKDSSDAREKRLGAYVLDFARKCGWQDDGEGAFEYVQRISYAQGLEDRSQDADKEDAARYRLIKAKAERCDTGWAYYWRLRTVDVPISQPRATLDESIDALLASTPR